MLLVVIVCGLPAAIGAYFLPVVPIDLAVKGGSVAEYKDLISRVGAEKAYALFSSRLDGATPAFKHAQAHLFGEALFKVGGETAIEVCDERFQYGCFHEFAAQAAVTEGAGVFRRFTDFCRSNAGHNFIVCEHGVGHAILAVAGYDESALNDALRICDLQEDASLRGCFGGVFMEYNIRTGKAEEGADPRPTGKNELDPCVAIADRYRSACAHWLPQWWIVKSDAKAELSRDSLRHMGMLCAQLQGDDRIACFTGLGIQLDWLDSVSPERLAQQCEVAGRSRMDVIACRNFGGRSMCVMWGQGDCEKVCAEAPPEERQECIGFLRTGSGNPLDVKKDHRLKELKVEGA